MFEKLRQFIDEGKNMIGDSFVVPDDPDFVAVPPGVTEEQLIEEAKQYVDAILVEPHHSHHQNLVGVDMGDKPHETDDPGTTLTDDAGSLQTDDEMNNASAQD